MKILALEFSSPQRSVAVLNGEADGGITAASEAVETGGRETNAFGMIEEALRRTMIEREQIEYIAVGIGPGSYTGVRAAIALAQGWQLARGVKLLGISSVECVAGQAQAEGATGTLNVVIDAQRNELYLARYDLRSTGCREVESLRLAALAEIQEREQAGETLTGPEITRWIAAGRTVFPRAGTLARLALDRNHFIAGERMEPIYLRETTFVKAPLPRVIPPV